MSLHLCLEITQISYELSCYESETVGKGENISFLAEITKVRFLAGLKSYKFVLETVSSQTIYISFND